MLKFLLQSLIILPITYAYGQTDYSTSEFSDPHRLEKMQRAFPKIKKIYQDYAKKNHFPGFAFGIMVDGKLVYSGTQGFGDIEEKHPVSTHSMFRIASMTKSFTAMAILQLRDAGKLKLDDPISLYIPELKKANLTKDAADITIRDLLTHSAGFPLDNAWGDRQLNMQQKEWIALLNNRLYFSNSPGTSFEYSNLGFALLGLIIDRVSGLPYQDYIAKNIWRPLDMSDISWEVATIPAEKRVQGYQWNKTSWHKEPMLADGVFGAMGGISTSIEAFSRYVALQQSAWPPRDDLETGPVKRSSLREMQQAWRFQTLNSNYQFLNGYQCPLINAYGYGLRWLQDCEHRTYVGHSGGLPGFGSNWFMMPDYGIGVIFFANSTYAPAAEVNIQVLDELIKDAQLKPRELRPSQLLKDKQKALVKLLQHWNTADAEELVADNFFLDSSLEARKQECQALFKQTGKIIRIQEITPENQLSGYFIMEGQKAKLKVSMMLTPQNPPLIQDIHMEILAPEPTV